MLSSGIIDLAIGLVFIFGVTAALASVITELISRFLGLRGAYLLSGLRELVDGDGAEGQAVETVLKSAVTDYRAMRSMVLGTAPDQTGGPAPNQPAEIGGPSPAEPAETAAAAEPAATAAPTAAVAAGEPAPIEPTTAGPAPTRPTTTEPAGKPRMSATSALLGSPVLRSQGMTGEIFSRDLIFQTGPGSRPNVTTSTGKRPWSALRSLPSYISAQSVSEAVIDILVPDEAGKTTMTTIQANIKNLPDGMPFKASLQALATSAGNDITTFRTSVENWYDDHMDRVSGWYKRHVAKFTIAAGAILVILLNLNAISIGRALYSNNVIGTAVSAVAADHTNCKSNENQAACLTSLQNELSAVAQSGLPIGWATVAGCTAPHTSCNWLQQRGILSPSGSGGASAWQVILVIIGFLITIVALTPGAQFWFGLLGKLGALRSTGPKPTPPSS